MPVERKKDGSVTIKSDNGVTVIGRMVVVSADKQEEKFKNWVEECAKMVTPCAHTLYETEEYFLQRCDALPLAPNDRRMKNFQHNVIMNYCKDKLEHQPPEFSFDMTDEEIEEWHKEQNAMREEAMNSSPEHFGLKIWGYYLPHTERNEVFYKEATLAAQRFVQRNGHDPEKVVQQDICFFFEETTGYCQSTGGGDDLMKQLVLFKGVSEDDIIKRNPQFLWYITTMCDMGKLPGIAKE